MNIDQQLDKLDGWIKDLQEIVDQGKRRLFFKLDEQNVFHEVHPFEDEKLALAAFKHYAKFLQDLREHKITNAQEEEDASGQKSRSR